MKSEIIQRLLDKITPEQHAEFEERLNSWINDMDRRQKWQDDEDNHIRKAFNLNRNADVFHLRDLWGGGDYFDYFFISHEQEEKYTLPHREGFSARVLREEGAWADYGKNYFHPVNGIWPYDRCNRILHKNIGKSFDDAFSKYCKEVPVYQQHIFLDYFTPDWKRWSVDNEGNIQYRDNKRKNKFTIKSWDYKSERVYIHKATGRETSYIDWRKHHEYDYEYKTVQGSIYYFDGKNHLYYKRLYYEQYQKRKALRDAVPTVYKIEKRLSPYKQYKIASVRGFHARVRFEKFLKDKGGLSLPLPKNKIKLIKRRKYVKLMPKELKS